MSGCRIPLLRRWLDVQHVRESIAMRKRPEAETRQRYTEREFVLGNVKFKDMDAVRQISLALAPVSERDFLSRGYC